MDKLKNRLCAPTLASAAILTLALTGCATGNTDFAGNDTPSAAATAPSTNGNASTNTPDDEEGDSEANGAILEWAEDVLDYDDGEGMVAGSQGRFEEASSNSDTYTSQAPGSYTVNAVCRDGGPVTFVVSSNDAEVARQDVTCDETIVPIQVTTSSEGLKIETSTKSDGADWAYALREGVGS
ncbi:hypothetical protein ACUWEX_02175 [Okibacterium fritillariae]|uniref:hypothetical protein n=1 Tax=Okibacterium fritillariae TaxID=123320 RepID=UPI0040553FEF